MKHYITKVQNRFFDVVSNYDLRIGINVYGAYFTDL